MSQIPTVKFPSKVRLSLDQLVNLIFHQLPNAALYINGQRKPFLSLLRKWEVHFFLSLHSFPPMPIIIRYHFNLLLHFPLLLFLSPPGWASLHFSFVLSDGRVVRPTATWDSAWLVAPSMLSYMEE
jgi:hypothetical protein